MRQFASARQAVLTCAEEGYFRLSPPPNIVPPTTTLRSHRQPTPCPRLARMCGSVTTSNSVLRQGLMRRRRTSRSRSRRHLIKMKIRCLLEDHHGSPKRKILRGHEPYKTGLRRRALCYAPLRASCQTLFSMLLPCRYIAVLSRFQLCTRHPTVHVHGKGSSLLSHRPQ